MIRQLKFLGGLLLAAGLAACGGGGGSAGTTNGSTGGGGTTTAPVPAAIEVFTSAPELTSAANSSISFTVVVKDANNVAMPLQTVTFAATSGNIQGGSPTPSTGAAGEAITTVSLSPGADRANRDITVTLKAGTVSKDVKVPVVGTAITLSGDSSILLNGSTVFTVRAADSAGQAVPNAQLTVASSLGGSVSPTTVTTNSQGAGTFTYTGTRSGNDKLTVTGLGTSISTSISVSSDEFRIESPVASSTVSIGATQTMTVRVLRSGVPLSGQTVTFSTTRGSVSPVAAMTDSNGRVSTVLSSTTTGPANVLAQTTSSQVTLPIVYVATVVDTVSLQANPGAIPPNTGTSTTNQATLRATVRDPAGNPVAGRVVNFTAIKDASIGTISPGSAVTDSAGTASAQFISGPQPTGNNEVLLQATAQNSTAVGTAVMTVSTQALFISIAEGNEVGQLDQTTYEKTFSVYVTDSNGAPVANRVLTLGYVPDYYAKGTLAWNGKSWERSATAFCLNEDVNRNGVRDPGEDINNSGKLEPGLPSVVAPSSVTTGANGFVTFKVYYGENYVPWVGGTLSARAVVAGTESVRTYAFDLQGIATDFTNEAVAPAGSISPFGTGASCTDPN